MTKSLALLTVPATIFPLIWVPAVVVAAENDPGLLNAATLAAAPPKNKPGLTAGVKAAID